MKYGPGQLVSFCEKGSEYSGCLKAFDQLSNKGLK
jgi:hypothetical protein